MPLIHDSQSHGRPGAPPLANADSNLSPAELAHELNSFLDGSMRSLRLALGDIDSPQQRNQVAINLQRAMQSLCEMACLLERVMNQPSLGVDVFDQAQPLHEIVRACVASLTPLAQAHGVAVRIDFTPRARSLPAATLAPIIQNGLRNAIESCAARPTGPREVELAIAISHHEQLLILISDTGVGLPLPPARRRHGNGHGIGLELCARIARHLGGSLRLANAPFDAHGAILQVTIPLRSLECHD